MTAGPGAGDPVRAEVRARPGVPARPIPGGRLRRPRRGPLGAGVGPTGSGKTVVADYAVARARARGRRAFYTTPLKALSNQKFSELAEVYGAEDVGLLTGDVSHHGRRRRGRHDDRGVAQHALRPLARSWPASGWWCWTRCTTSRTPTGGRCGRRCIILTPPEVVFVCLSATVANADAVRRVARAPCGVPPRSSSRSIAPSSCAITWPWPRRGAVASSWCRCCTMRKIHPKALALDQRVARLARRPGGVRHSRLDGPRRSELIEALDDRDHVAGHRLHLLASRLRRRRGPVPVGRDAPHDPGGASRDPAPLRGAHRGASRRGAARPRVRAVGGGSRSGPGVASRRADPRLPRGGGGLLLLQPVAAWCSPPRRWRSASTCRLARS